MDFMKTWVSRKAEDFTQPWVARSPGFHAKPRISLRLTQRKENEGFMQS